MVSTAAEWVRSILPVAPATETKKKNYSIIINTFIYNIRKCVNYTSSRLPHVEMGKEEERQGRAACRSTHEREK